MEVNNIYDLLHKFLLLKNTTLSKLLVLSFPEGSVGTIDRTSGFFPKQILSRASVRVQHCRLTSSRGHLFIRASAAQPWGIDQLRPCHGNQPSASYSSYPNLPLEGTPLNLGIILVHLLPLGCSAWTLRSCRGAGRSRALHTRAVPRTAQAVPISVQTFSPISR